MTNWISGTKQRVKQIPCVIQILPVFPICVHLFMTSHPGTQHRHRKPIVRYRMRAASKVRPGDVAISWHWPSPFESLVDQRIPFQSSLNSSWWSWLIFFVYPDVYLYLYLFIHKFFSLVVTSKPEVFQEKPVTEFSTDQRASNKNQQTFHPKSLRCQGFGACGSSSRGFRSSSWGFYGHRLAGKPMWHDVAW